MCYHHRPVAGACSQWWYEWLATGSVCLCCLWSDCWFFEHMTVLHFWCHRTDWLLLFRGLLYLLIWMLHLWSLAAHEPLLSSTASGLHVWLWSWSLSHHQCTFWCKQSQFQYTPAGQCGCCRWPSFWTNLASFRSGLYAGISITEMLSEYLRWGRGTALYALFFCCVNKVQCVVSPCCKVHMLVELWQNCL